MKQNLARNIDDDITKMIMCDYFGKKKNKFLGISRLNVIATKTIELGVSSQTNHRTVFNRKIERTEKSLKSRL